MGIDKQLVIGKQVDFTCSFCSNLPYPPIELKCTHLICEVCCNICANECPTCKKIDDGPRNETETIKLINNLQIRCPGSEECLWCGYVKNLEEHLLQRHQPTTNDSNQSKK